MSQNLGTWKLELRLKGFLELPLKTILVVIYIACIKVLSTLYFQVGSRLIELLMQTAYIQPPADQLADGPPDIRPAFIHRLRTLVRDAK